MDGEEIKLRVRECARLFAAWPNARPLSLDSTLMEFVNATRGVAIERLEGFVSEVIEAGGEFLPPAGAIVQRVANARATALATGYNAHVSIEERTRKIREQEQRAMREASERVEPLRVSAVETALQQIGAGASQTTSAPRRLGA
jgi:hypothetical protein